MRKKLMILVLILCAVLSGCGTGPAGTTAAVSADTEGKYVSGERVGNESQHDRFGVKVLECTDDGIYYIQSTPISEYATCDAVYFSPYGSDTMILLCGRPDCTHDSLNCNAFFSEISCTISSYNGYLYVVGMDGGNKTTLFNMYRMDPNGNNRVKVLDGTSLSGKYLGYSGMSNIMNGIFFFELAWLDENGEQQSDCFYYKLDGSMSKPEQTENIPETQDGDTLLLIMKPFELDDGTHTYVCSWDPETAAITKLFDRTKYTYETHESIYVGTEALFYCRDGAVTMVHYSDGTEEVLFDTDLENITPRFFPDCVIFISTDENDPKFYCYDWNGNNLGEVCMDFECVSLRSLIGGETPDRIFLCTTWNNLPQYYINKSDFGTGTIELHEVQYPDLSEAEYQAIFTIK